MTGQLQPHVSTVWIPEILLDSPAVDAGLDKKLTFVAVEKSR
jgi:hypothetical protein